MSKRLEYVDTFSIQRWKELPLGTKKKHSVSYCKACYDTYPSLQNAFPGKPVYEPEKIVSLPGAKSERELASEVLAELNTTWENQFSHTFTEAITTVLPECKLVQKRGKTENKKHDRAQKRKIVSHINDHFAQNATMSLLAEAESLASYGRKRLALSYEQPTTTQSKKSHSPNENKMTWDVNAAMVELETFPPDQKINWSQMARKYGIPQKKCWAGSKGNSYKTWH